MRTRHKRRPIVERTGGTPTPRKDLPPWSRYDIDFPNGDDYLALPASCANDAYTLLLALNGHGKKEGTDGVVPATTAAAIAIRLHLSPRQYRRCLDALSIVELIRADDTCVVVLKFAKWSETAAEVDEAHAKRAAAGALGGRRSGETRRSNREASASAMLHHHAKQNEADIDVEIETDVTKGSLTPRRSPNGSGGPDAFVAEVVQVVEEVTSRPPSAAGVAFLERLAHEAPRVTAAALGSKYRLVAAKFIELNKPPPAITYLAGWCREENARLADQGVLRDRAERRREWPVVGEVLTAR